MFSELTEKKISYVGILVKMLMESIMKSGKPKEVARIERKYFLIEKRRRIRFC